MNSEEIKAVNELRKSIQDSMVIEFTTVGDDISGAIEETLEDMVASSPCLRLKKMKDSDQDEPYILIRKNIRLKARPYEKLFHMFVELMGMSLQPDQKRFVNHEDVQKILAPVFLKVYVAPFCPYCPNVVKEMTALALSSDRVHIDIIDGTLFTEKAKTDQIMAAPTVICDDKHRWSGRVSVQEILDVIVNRKPEELSPHTLKAMIEAGNAATLGEMMVVENKVFPAIYSLLTDDKWPVRLGAMVTVQTIHELKPELSSEVIDHLWERFNDVSDTVKGDVIYLTGEVASEKHQEKLNALLETDLADDLREAVLDALEIIANN